MDDAGCGVAASSARPLPSVVVAAVSTFHLHARLFEGTLAAPTRNELQSAESDDRAEVMALAEQLAARGFAVWLYEHGPTRLTNGEGAYRVIAEWNVAGDRVR